MDKFDRALLLRIESLLQNYQYFVKDGEGSAQEEGLVYGLRCLVNLANMILRDVPIFGIEPWHVISNDAKLKNAGELLLRLKDYQGNPMPPYPFIMALYDNGFTAQLDTILALSALRKFPNERCQEVSINVSARSLRDPDFVKVVLERLETMRLRERRDVRVIFEIHESTANLVMSKSVLKLFREVGCYFSIDDVGLSMNDVMRLAEFDGIADYIKLDRHCGLYQT